jgi:D-amino peptidase
VKVFISVDLEGVTGLTDAREMDFGHEDYPIARRLMTGDANAAIAGAFDAGATEVVVCDSHGPARTLLVEELDSRATLIRGLHKPGKMVEGLDSSFDAMFLVGYHARAGTAHGILNHTWLGKEIQDVWLNGEPAGELRLVAAVAGHYGVPVVLVTGDDVCCAEASELLPHVHAVQVKEAIDRFAARVTHPDVTGPRIREGAAAALRNAEARVPLRLDGSVVIEVEWSSTSIAHLCELIPGVTSTASRRSHVEGPDVVDAYRAFVAMCIIAGAAGQQLPYS